MEIHSISYISIKYFLSTGLPENHKNVTKLYICNLFVGNLVYKLGASSFRQTKRQTFVCLNIFLNLLTAFAFTIPAQVITVQIIHILFIDYPCRTTASVFSNCFAQIAKILEWEIMFSRYP